jgi:hypothetical protein
MFGQIVWRRPISSHILFEGRNSLAICLAYVLRLRADDPKACKGAHAELGLQDACRFRAFAGDWFWPWLLPIVSTAGPLVLLEVCWLVSPRCPRGNCGVPWFDLSSEALEVLSRLNTPPAGPSSCPSISLWSDEPLAGLPFPCSIREFGAAKGRSPITGSSL